MDGWNVARHFANSSIHPIYLAVPWTFQRMNEPQAKRKKKPHTQRKEMMRRGKVKHPETPSEPNDLRGR